MSFRIAEFPNRNWIIQAYLDIPIRRDKTTARDYLHDLGIEYVRGFYQKADLHILPNTGRVPHLKNKAKYLATRLLNSGKNPIHLIVEPREIAPLAYKYAPRNRTLASSPGSEFQRMFFPGYWKDPELEGWGKRLDRIVWFARPYPDRVEYARNLIARGVPLDIYNYHKWDLPQWKGPAEDFNAIAKNYKYQLIIEPSQSGAFHSEKLFKSVGIGCVPFFQGGISADLSHVPQLSLVPELENLINRDELAAPVLERMNQFMFSNQWHIYSAKEFFDRLLQFSSNRKFTS